MSVLFRLHEVSKFFRDHSQRTHVLQHVTLDVHEREFLVIVGPSGSGKSTLLRVMSRLETDFSGRLAYLKDISRSEVSFVFQHFALLPWLTVYQNVEVNLLARGGSRPENHRRVLQTLKQFDLQQCAQFFPKDLSGGMQQRVGLARALINDPKVIFMDEPFSELDSFTADELRAALLATWRERNLTIVLVTHIVQEAVELADRIAIFTPRPGSIEHVLKNDLPRPRNRRSAEFFALEDRVVNLIRPH